ncbi:dolichol-phosphate mannosyltransferase [Dysgonomonas hofstadii]|uniref:Dolichol-phosphate mannosyltransferase n=1 Tax=Dysgonomonas hofstadii TaxID=637886 RepID=A0A840CMM3_9BACT|nr:glycosyltransferase family 2 protein [Dysgonomonas hofstadii]MBB4035939.1 dolichol-phosphate mannosyltransferase [Dysgonomonas hofstadii]
MPGKISIVICCYNEYTNLPTVINAIHENIKPTGYQYEIIAVNDGSVDGSQELLEELSQNDENLFYIEFSRNFGHQNALKAGIDHASGDCVISMDADMQHPPRLLPEFIQKWEEGYDIVYTRRECDPSLGLFKRISSKYFYKFLNAVSDIKMEKGAADFRLMDRHAADVLVNIKGGDLFIRGLVNWIGFKQYAIDYQPDKRLSGSTKYTIKKMLRMAALGVISFSSKPLQISLYLGFIIALLSLLFIPYAAISFFIGHAKAGWVSLILTISFLGGLQLFILGIIGLYIGRIFAQTKGYPPYIVRSTNLTERE